MPGRSARERRRGLAFIVGSHRIAGAPGALDPVQRLVGGLVEFAELQGVAGKQGDADARCDHQPLLGELHRFRQFSQQAFGDVAGMLLGIRPADQHGEFVAAEARHAILGAHAMAQPLGHVLQDEVAGIVAMGIVDRLEVIQVDQQQRHAVAVAARVVRALSANSIRCLRLPSPVSGS